MMPPIARYRAVLLLVFFMTLGNVPSVPHAEAHKPSDHKGPGPKSASDVSDSRPTGVTERLGEVVAVDAVLLDEEGKPVRFSDLLSLPTLLLPVYYGCPNVCSFLQANVAKVLPQVDLAPGREFQVISLSFDHTETPAMARQAKVDFFPAAGERWPPSAWRFLTGDEMGIKRVTDSIGFRFSRDEDQFVHPVVMVALAPGGKIVRYLYGYTPLPFDITMAMTEASEGHLGLSVKRALTYCFSYDPKGKRYALNVIRVAGFAVVALALVLFLALMLGGRKRKLKV